MTAHNPIHSAGVAEYDFGFGLHPSCVVPFDPENLAILVQALADERRFVRFL